MVIRLRALTFCLVLFLAFLTRFYLLGQNPRGLNLDEVIIGYDAYSVLKTGTDQYGSGSPLYFRSHDDYKPPLLIYLAIPPIALFGETGFAVRFSSATLGVLAVFMSYFLIKELFIDSSKKETIGLIASFLLSISPWHLQFTRTAYEVGMQPFYTVTGLYFFLRGIRRNERWAYVLSAVFLGLGIYLYTASRIFIPLLVLSMGVIYFRNIILNIKRIWVFVFTFIIFLLPALYLFTTPAGQFRFKGTNIFQDPKMVVENTDYKQSDLNLGAGNLGAIYHPYKLAYVQEIMFGYLSHFRLDFLLLGRDGPPANYVPHVGLVYFFEIPFLFIGFSSLFKRSDKRTGLILLLWFLIAPIPASVTYGVPTSIRLTVILPVFQLVSAYGLFCFLRKIIDRKLLILSILGYSVLVTTIFSYYLHMYYLHAPIVNSRSWYYGYDQVVKDTMKMAPNYNKVIISTSLDQPHGFFLFYGKYDPSRYLKIDGGTISGGFREDRNHFDKFYFKPINWQLMLNEKKVLFVGRITDFPAGTKFLKQYYYQNGESSVVIYGT